MATDRDRDMAVVSAGRSTQPARPTHRLHDQRSTVSARPVVERVQRGRMVVDVCAADLEAAEAALGPFHPTTCHFRAAWHDAQRACDRLRAELGGVVFTTALDQPPAVVLALGPGADAYRPNRAGRWPLPRWGTRNGPAVLLIAIGGQTYRVLRVEGTALAPLLWRLTRLTLPLDDGPYYACCLNDGSTQCDCADWTYHIAEADPRGHCKHLAALAALGWL